MRQATSWARMRDANERHWSTARGDAQTALIRSTASRTCVSRLGDEDGELGRQRRNNPMKDGRTVARKCCPAEWKTARARTAATNNIKPSASTATMLSRCAGQNGARRIGLSGCASKPGQVRGAEMGEFGKVMGGCGRRAARGGGGRANRAARRRAGEDVAGRAEGAGGG